MSFDLFDVTIKQTLNSHLKKLENHLDSDVFYYFGGFYVGLSKYFCDFIEQLKLTAPKSTRTTLTIILNTMGGVAEDVEKIVDILRYHYDTVNFVVPDMAMSAGTIFVMSGDKIYMDYSSSLGPIDPQVVNKQGQYVPAMGYLDKIAEMYDKAANKTLTPLDYAFIQGVDLAELRKYEQAKELSIKLVTKFLENYKFKSWTTHRTNNPGTPVTPQEKKARAEEIAGKLCDNSYWSSHGRYIGIETLKNELNLEIENYSTNPTLKNLIRTYNDLVFGYISTNKYGYFFHTRKFI